MTILFIDDDPDDTDIFCEAVQHLNNSKNLEQFEKRIECVSVNNGCTALEILPKLSHMPDIIFLDINMPRMGGKECLENLKRDPIFSEIPVVMFSTTIRHENKAQFIALGAAACFAKPSGFDELVDIVAKAINELC